MQEGVYEFGLILFVNCKKQMKTIGKPTGKHLNHETFMKARDDFFQMHQMHQTILNPKKSSIKSSKKLAKSC